MTHESLSDRSLRCKLSCHEISLILSYESKGHDLVGIEVLYLYLVEHLNLLCADLRLVDYTRVSHEILKFRDIKFKKSLSLSRRLILCIL